MTDISGPLAHQLPLHNHRGGLVQPSLVMNHHHMECHGNDIRISKSASLRLCSFFFPQTKFDASYFGHALDKNFVSTCFALLRVQIHYILVHDCALRLALYGLWSSYLN